MNFVSTIFQAFTGTSTQELQADISAAQQQITLAVEAIIVLLVFSNVLLFFIMLNTKKRA